MNPLLTSRNRWLWVIGTPRGRGIKRTLPDTAPQCFGDRLFASIESVAKTAETDGEPALDHRASNIRAPIVTANGDNAVIFVARAFFAA